MGVNMNKKSSASGLAKIFIWGIITVLVLAVSFFTAAGIQYFYSSNSDYQFEILEGPHPVSDSDAVLGSAYAYSAVFRLPWGMRVDDAKVVPGNGLQLPSEPTFKLIQYSWGWDVYELAFSLQPYRAEDITESTLDVAFLPKNGVVQRGEFKIPPPVVVLPADDDESDIALRQAGILEKTSQKNLTFAHYIVMLLVGAVLVFLVVLVLRDVFKKTADEKKSSLQDVTISSINELGNAVERHSISVESALVSLTDIVRHYLEKRFNLPARRRTTEEFLSGLERDKKSALRESDRGFLKGFLEAADMVKFARLEADPGLFLKASESAVALVESSRPVEEKDSVKGEGDNQNENA